MLVHPAAFDDHALLALWEQALPLGGAAREALLAAACGGAAGPLGVQRRQLLAALRPWLGERAALHGRCPACGEAIGFELALSPLLQALQGDAAAGEQRLELDGWRLHFRLPALQDLAALDDGGEDVEAFVRGLLRRCVLAAEAGGRACAADALPAPVADALSRRMEALDPAATLAFDLACPACAHAWSAPFDAAQALWACLQAAAERTLLEVDALAARYGWSEPQVLALSPARRRAYLQLAGVA